MAVSLQERVDRYDAGRPLSEAATIPASWYVDSDIAELERRTVFSHAWQGN